MPKSKSIRPKIIERDRKWRAKDNLRRQQDNRRNRPEPGVLFDRTPQMQRLINSLSNRERRRWHWGGCPGTLAVFIRVMWPITDPEIIAERLRRAK